MGKEMKGWHCLFGVLYGCFLVTLVKLFSENQSEEFLNYMRMLVIGMGYFVYMKDLEK
jgi:hypothetical protein